MAKTPKRPTLRDVQCRIAITKSMVDLAATSGTTQQLARDALSEVSLSRPFSVADRRLDAALAAAHAQLDPRRREELRAALGRAIGDALAIAKRCAEPEPTCAQAAKRFDDIAKHAVALGEALDVVKSPEELACLAAHDAPRREQLADLLASLATAAERAALDVKEGRYDLARPGRHRAHATRTAVTSLVPVFREFFRHPARRTDDGAESGPFLNFCLEALANTELDTGSLSGIVRDVLVEQNATTQEGGGGGNSRGVRS